MWKWIDLKCNTVAIKWYLSYLVAWKSLFMEKRWRCGFNSWLGRANEIPISVVCFTQLWVAHMTGGLILPYQLVRSSIECTIVWCRLFGANPTVGNETRKGFPLTTMRRATTPAGSTLLKQVSPPRRPYSRIWSVLWRISSGPQPLARSSFQSSAGPFAESRPT